MTTTPDTTTPDPTTPDTTTLSANPATPGVRPFVGVHCETVATGTLLAAIGCELSEPMLFGLGEAFGFVFLNLSGMPLGFLGGRSKPFALTVAACRNLGVECRAEETTSQRRGWDRLCGHLDAGRPVGLQLDCYYLPYFHQAPHFAGHVVAATGRVGDEVEVVDTVQQGTRQRVPRAALTEARHAKGPMSARARAFTIVGTPPPDPGAAALTALRATATAYLAPDFGGMGAPGLARLAKAIPTWLRRSEDPAADLRLTADLMERAGTGGALFRNLYRDFLAEAAELLPAQRREIERARDHVAASAERWTELAALLEQCADDGRAEHLTAAAALCAPIADDEVAAMRLLAGARTP